MPLLTTEDHDSNSSAPPGLESYVQVDIRSVTEDHTTNNSSQCHPFRVNLPSPKKSTETVNCDGAPHSKDRTHVVNELLCFIPNRMDVMARDTLVSICTQLYTEAKRVLFVNVDTKSRKQVNPRGDLKSKHNLEDIMKVMYEAEAADTPLFTAQVLANLPPMSVDCIDSLQLRTAIETLKEQVSILSANQKDMYDLMQSSRSQAPIHRNPEPSE